MSAAPAAVLLKAFRPSVHKVYHLDVHPTQPWLVTSDGGDNVVVWDWEHRQVLYELNAAGVDERRLVDTQLQKLAEGEADAKGRATGAEAIRGGGVKDVKFYDDDVRFWSQWMARSAAAEAPTMSSAQISLPAIGGAPGALRGRRFLVMCCEYKAIFLDLVTMRARDVTKAQLENRTPLCVEFLPRAPGGGDGPFAAIGGPDGVIRVLSLASWQIVRKHVGGHKGAVHCLLTFMAANGEVLLISGGSDGVLVMWSTESNGNAVTKEVGPKVTIPKAHDGGVISVALARVMGAPPQLVTCGADKTVAIWDSLQCRELRRIKPVSKMVVNAVASWQHPRASSIDVLATVKDSHVWAIDNTGHTVALCNLANQIPATPQLAAGKKLKMYCMVVHPLKPHLIAVGSNMGTLLLEFAPKVIPPAAALPAAPGTREQLVVYATKKYLHALAFQVAPQIPANAAAPPAEGMQAAGQSAAGLANLATASRGRADSADASSPQVRQSRTRLAATQSDGFAQLAVSKSGNFVSVVWTDRPSFVIYRTSDWTIVDSGSARHFAWDTCQDRYAFITAVALPQLERVSSSRGLRSSKKKEAAEREAAQRVAAAEAALLASSVDVEIKTISPSGVPTTVCKALEGRKEAVIGLQGGALLGVAYRVARRSSALSSVVASAAASAVSAAQAGALSGLAPGAVEESKTASDKPANFLLFSWDSFKPVSPLLPQPTWSAWDPAVENCALAYPTYVILATLRPQFRYLGNVAIEAATGGVWHRRQLFLATPSTIECVFVDAGVSEIDIERKRQKAEQRAKAALAKAVAEKGELAVLTMEAPKVEAPLERVQLRPPMLQVVRLASFQTSPAVPPISAMVKVKTEAEQAVAGLLDGPEVKAPEVVVGGGGVSVATTRLPPEQRRPVGPLLVVGVRDGVLWLVDRHMTAHAIGLSHPGIRCRCLAAYGDPVSAVKWASRLGREHHDDMAQFMVGMGYAREALHLPGISKRFELELAMQCGELQRALRCLQHLSATPTSTGDLLEGALDTTPDTTGVLALAEAHSKTMDQVAGVARLATEYLELIDAADATGQQDIAAQALRQLAGAGTVEGALQSPQLRALALRLATHGEAARLQRQSLAMVKAAQGGEAAAAAALLGDANLLEKAWQDTGMIPQAALHAQAHGRPSLQTLLQQWNRLLQKDQSSYSHSLSLAQGSHPTSAASLFSTLQKAEPSSAAGKLNPQGRQPLVEISPPGNFAATEAAQPPSELQGLGLPPGIAPFAQLGGIQGLKAPLDLSLLEGRGPAPQKGPPAIAVPLDFSILEAKKDENKGEAKATREEGTRPDAQQAVGSQAQQQIPGSFPTSFSVSAADSAPEPATSQAPTGGSGTNSGLFVGSAEGSRWANGAPELEGEGGTLFRAGEYDQKEVPSLGPRLSSAPAPQTPPEQRTSSGTSKGRFKLFRRGSL